MHGEVRRPFLEIIGVQIAPRERERERECGHHQRYNTLGDTNMN